MSDMKLIFWILIFILAHSTFALAQFKNSGSLGLHAQKYEYDLGNDFKSDFLNWTLSSRIDYKSFHFKLKSDLNIQDEFSQNSAESETLIQIKNLYFELPLNKIKTRWGYQTLQVDGPDFANPANMMHAENWTDPTNPLTLASLGLSASYEFEQWQVELLFVPKQTLARLPHEKSAWWPRQKRLMVETEDTELRIPDDIKYNIQEMELIDDADLNNVALLIKQKGESLETQIAVYDGLSMNPFILTELTAQVISLNPTQILLLESPIILKPIGYRHSVTAATFLIPFETWSIKGGTQFSKPKKSDDRIPDSSQSSTLGFEKNWETSLGMTTHILQLTHEPTAEKNQLSFLRSIFAKAVCYGVRVPLSDESDVLAAHIYDTIGQSTVTRTQFNYRLNDATSFLLSAQWLSGPKDTLLNLYEEYDSYAAQINYHW